MTTRKLRARSQSKQAEVFDLMQNWCIFFHSVSLEGFCSPFFPAKKKEQSIIAMLSLTTIAKVDILGL